MRPSFLKDLSTREVAALLDRLVKNSRKVSTLPEQKQWCLRNAVVVRSILAARRRAGVR